MKTKIKNVTINGNETSVTIKTPLGEFTGVSHFNEEADSLQPSKILGGRIAEDRAYIKFYNELIRNKRNELKGVRRLVYSTKPDKPGFNHICHMESAIVQEYYDLKRKKLEYVNDIKQAVESRKIYVRSRTENKEEKQKKLEELGNAIKTLGQNISKE